LAPLLPFAQQRRQKRRFAWDAAVADTARAMSVENIESVRGVRTPVVVPPENRRRTLDERIFARFPVLVRAIASRWSRLPPRSRLRRAFVSRLMRQGCEAANRRDFDLLFLFLDPEIELELEESPFGGFVPPDLPAVNHGHGGYLRAWEAMIEAMEDFRIELDEVVDFGDRLLTPGRFMGHGTASGAPVTQPIFQVFTLRRGLVIRQEDFVDRDKAVEAAGLSG
jgi:ketosteroid isomerase-like protein